MLANDIFIANFSQGNEYLYHVFTVDRSGEYNFKHNALIPYVRRFHIKDYISHRKTNPKCRKFTADMRPYSEWLNVPFISFTRDPKYVIAKRKHVSFCRLKLDRKLIESVHKTYDVNFYSGLVNDTEGFNGRHDEQEVRIKSALKPLNKYLKGIDIFIYDNSEPGLGNNINIITAYANKHNIPLRITHLTDADKLEPNIRATRLLKLDDSERTWELLNK